VKDRTITEVPRRCIVECGLSLSQLEKEAGVLRQCLLADLFGLELKEQKDT